MNRFIAIKAFIAVFLLSTVLCTVSPAREPSTFERINSAQARGEVTRGRAELEKLRDMFAPERVSPFFRSLGERKRSLCATMALRGAIDALPLMDPAEQEEARSYLLPRTAAALPSLPNAYNTLHFSIQWGDDFPLTDIDGTVPAPDANENGDPDVIERWANYLEYSYTTLSENYGFPVNVLSGRVKVVIANTSDLSVYRLSAGFFGLATDASPQPWLMVNNTFNWPGFTIENDDPDNPYWGAMKVTGVHEFFHVLQMLYTPSAWIGTYDDWFLEASSVWSEDKVFDEVNDYYSFWNNSSDQWIKNPESGLQISRPYGDGVYERGIFCFYLDEHTGGPDSMARVWELIKSGKRILYSNSSNNAVTNGALELFALEKALDGVDELYLGFASANSIMDYEEGAFYPRPNLRSTSSIEVVASTLSPDYLGASYRRENGTNGPVRATVTGAPADNWGITGVIQRGSPAYALCLASKGTAGFASFQFDEAQSSDLLFAAPAYLKPAGVSQSFSVEKPTPSPVQGTVPPALTSADVSSSPVTGGINVSWTPLAYGGTVMRYKPVTSGQWQTKTVVAPLGETTISGLAGETNHNVEIWLYDARGVEGGHFSFTALSGPALPPVPQAEKIIVPPATGGGGGGGCFIEVIF
ncbi:hypothetical protein EPN96_07565 [bacterium]|nr:MAG: hypothetical protein EPN96_07565 [bacterium]